MGEEEAAKVKEEYQRATDNKAKDAVLITLFSQGYSQVQIRALLNVGGYKTNRIQHYLKLDPQEREELANTSHVPKHAFTEEDKARLRNHINSYDLQPGFPCAHREPMQYFAIDLGNWKDVYQKYKESLGPQPDVRVMSINRWREYVRYFFPRLRVKQYDTDVCNCCYRIDTELKYSDISDEHREELLLEKAMHLGKGRGQNINV